MTKLKKIVGVLLAVAMLATLFAACGEKEPVVTSDGDIADKHITLQWALWDYETTPYWAALKEAYEKENENVTIEYVDLGSTDYGTLLATELSGSGSDFDIVTIKDIPSYNTLINKGVLEPLSDDISAAGIDTSLYSGIVEQVTVDKEVYELPFRSDFWVLFYNKDIFDAAGVAYPDNDMTFDEYDALAREVAANTEKGIYGAHYHTWRSAVSLFGVLDGKHTILDGSYDCMKPYYEMVINQQNDGVCMDYTTLTTEGLHYSAVFSQGQAAMMNMGSWYISTIIASLKNGDYDSSLCGNWGMVKYPHAQGVEAGSTLGTITGLAVVAESDVKDAAFDFVSWVAGEEGAKVLAETGNFPALMNDDIASIISGMDGFPTDAGSAEALNVSNLYLETPYADNIADIETILNNYHSQIMLETISVDDAIAAMNSEVANLG